MARRKLNERQYAAIAILSLPDRGGLTYKQVGERVGVSEQTIHNWRKLDVFNDEIKKQVLRNAVDDLPKVFASVPRHIIDEGNAAMFRTYVQSLGMLTERVEVEDKRTGSEDIDVMRDEIERFRQRNAKDD